MNDQPQEKLSDLFRRMADRIDHNVDSRFAGAAVIIIPGGQFEPIEILMLDTAQDPAQFIGTISTKFKMMLTTMDDRQRALQGFGGR